MELGKIIFFFLLCLVGLFGFVVLVGFVCFKVKNAKAEAAAKPGRELAALRLRIAYFERPRRCHEETWTVLGQLSYIGNYRVLLESELQARKQLRERLHPEDQECIQQCALINDLETKLRACVGKH